jgi:hypothetical protein
MAVGATKTRAPVRRYVQAAAREALLHEHIMRELAAKDDAETPDEPPPDAA